MSAPYCEQCDAHGIETPATTTEPEVISDGCGGLERGGYLLDLCGECARVSQGYPLYWCPLCGGSHVPGDGTPGYSCEVHA